MRMISNIVLLISLALASASCTSADDTKPPERLELVAGGWSFGFCHGACRGVLTFDGNTVQYTISSREPGEPPYLENAGVLTEQGRDELRSTVAALRGVMLQAQYGCPDCADGGAAYVRLARDGEVSTHIYEFGNPPPALSTLDAQITALMDALETCKKTERIDIEPGCMPRRSR